MKTHSLFSHALVSRSEGHEAALAVLKKDIETQKKGASLR